MLLTTVFVVLYAVLTAFYLAKPAPGCDETSRTDGPFRALTILGPLAAISGIATGALASVRSPRAVGLATIVVDGAMIVAGSVLLLANIGHVQSEFCY